jgi:hypothetical protein
MGVTITEPINHEDLVASSGPMKGLHAGMGIAAKAMIVVFVVFTGSERRVCQRHL